MNRSYLLCLLLLIIGLICSISNHWPLRASISGFTNSTGKVAAKRDGNNIPTFYTGPAELEVALQQNLARPLTLASADFDEDGVPDLVSGYDNSNAGILTLHRGNVDSIYPNSPQAQQRKASGE